MKTGNLRHGLGLLVVALIAGIVFLVARAGGIDMIASLAAVAAFLCALFGLSYVAIGLFQGDTISEAKQRD